MVFLVSKENRHLKCYTKQQQEKDLQPMNSRIHIMTLRERGGRQLECVC